MTRRPLTAQDWAPDSPLPRGGPETDGAGDGASCPVPHRRPHRPGPAPRRGPALTAEPGLTFFPVSVGSGGAGGLVAIKDVLSS